ncbi:PTS glucose transporter subunit IIA [Alteromonas oceanisediminis]|uniref:PTS glucose transporter subunit IIA n=1 Tax=Alteromonas oceanisediminis TaxID=2836180 RepID=UPI001BD97DE1|nr:PTS glucose transporter subunit IIA [Alteromonas oceanisediminis]MBT0587295.1 PTS glucose transporter subunit IIA [Alteromonas oceanisediminis]
MHCLKPKISDSAPQQFRHAIALNAPVSGQLQPLSDSTSPLLAMRMAGDGVLIKLTGTAIYAPFNASLSCFLPTLQIVEWRASNGLVARLTFEDDLSSLHGCGFTRYVNQGDSVEAGTLLCHIDKNKVKLASPELRCALTIVNANKLTAIVPKAPSASGIARVQSNVDTLMTLYI